MSRAFLAAINFPTFKFEFAAEPDVTTFFATVDAPDAPLRASMTNWSILLPIAFDTT